MLSPALPFVEYQDVSKWHKFCRAVSKEEFRPFVTHTRDYCFSGSLDQCFGKIEKVYTVFSVIFLHCGLVYEKLDTWDRRKLDKDIRVFNRHWGMFVFESDVDWKIFKELQRSWVEMKICLAENRFGELVFEVEGAGDVAEVVRYVEGVRRVVKDISSPLFIDWMEVKEKIVK